MALKDYKKIIRRDKNIIQFKNKKTGDIVGIYLLTNKKWETLTKKFKTKQQALKFAKSYMRKH